jgi:dUTP pyrophosphatase
MTPQASIPFQIEVIDPRVIGPSGELQQFTKGTAESAGYDLVAWPEGPVTLRPGECKIIPLGVKLWINEPGVFGMVAPRSGLGGKKGLVMGNTIGVIDSDYQGAAMLFAFNRNHRMPNVLERDRDVIVINPGERIAQIIFVPCLAPNFELVPEFKTQTGRGAGGFGSTGITATPAVV